MTNCLIVYFSLGGTTKKVADKIVTGLESVGYNVDLHDITKGLPPSIENYDLLGIGSPAYYTSTPFIITNYLKSLPKLNIPFFTFILYGFIIANAGNHVRKRLSKKGGRDVGFFKSNGKEDFYGYTKNGLMINPSHPDANDLERAVIFGKSIKSNIENEDYIPEDFDKKPNFMFRLQYFMHPQWMFKALYHRFFKVNKSKCTKCEICVNSCPVGNINMENSEYPKWGKDCLGCYNCVLSCPEVAIKSFIDWKMAAPILKYDINYVKKLPDVEIVKVQLIKGKVERVD